MALRADRRLMPSANPTPEGDPPTALAGANLFAPISTANRITGQSRASRLHAREGHLREQLASGSNYDYGRGDAEPFPTVPAFSADAYTASFNPGALTATFARVPPTFLHRTMATPDVADKPSPFGYGLAHMTAPEALRQAYAVGTPVDRPDFTAGMLQFEGAPEATVFYSGMPLPETPAPARAATDGISMTTQDGDRYPADMWAAPTPPPPQGGDASPYPGSQSQEDDTAPPAGAPPAGKRASRRAQSPAAQGDAPAQTAADAPYAPFAVPEAMPQGDARRYVPRHGGGALGEPAVQAAQQPAPRHTPSPANPANDVWQMLGWKQAGPDADQSTAVWRVSDLTMFERAVFSDPLDPLRNPPEGAATPGAPYSPTGAALPGDTSGGFMPTGGYPQPANPSGAYAAYPPDMFDSQAYPAQQEEYAPEVAYGAWQDTPRPARAPRTLPVDAPTPGSVRQVLGKITPGRLILYIALALALLFCLIEGAKIVRSLWQAERNPSGFESESGQPANGVELLPAGVTYAPTASPVPASTLTPTPRVSQYDPLIGVVDAGGAQASAAIPTPTAATRTRLTKYPDNALLSISPAFDALRQENADVVARLTIDGLLDETVVQRNNTFYLNHNARGVLAATGAVFVDESCQLKKPPENLLLRAQANTDGKLFSPLKQYEQGGTAFLTQHGIVRCDTLYEQAQYVIFAILRADSVVGSADYFNYAGYPTFPSDALMASYVQAAKQKSLYQVEVGVKPSDRLLTLATVSEGSDTTSLVILCRKLRTGESATSIARD